MKFYGGSVAFQLEISLNEIFMGHGSSHDGQGDAPGPGPEAPGPGPRAPGLVARAPSLAGA